MGGHLTAPIDEEKIESPGRDLIYLWPGAGAARRAAPCGAALQGGPRARGAEAAKAPPCAAGVGRAPKRARARALKRVRAEGWLAARARVRSSLSPHTLTLQTLHPNSTRTSLSAPQWGFARAVRMQRGVRRLAGGRPPARLASTRW